MSTLSIFDLVIPRMRKSNAVRTWQVCANGKWLRGLASSTLLLSGAACHDLTNLAGKQTLPSGVSDPNTYHTPAGALQMYTGALYTFQASASNSVAAGSEGAFVDVVLASGVLTDELQAGNLGGSSLSYIGPQGITAIDSLDARQFPEMTNPYKALQAVRGATNQAIGALATYDSTVSPALRGHLYALQAYAELLLADLYCSGIPLSTLDFNADFTYRAGSTTQAVYQHALALFDTAISLSVDSTRILNLARIGKGRVLLDLGRYSEAGAAVTAVPDDYQYAFFVNWAEGTTASSLFSGYGGSGVSVSDQEGGNGVPFISSNDPRTTAVQYSTNAFGVPRYAPVKYWSPSGGVSPIIVASGLEARLIQAEAALNTGDPSWLTILNTLRTNGNSTTVSAATIVDTLGVTGCGIGTPDSPYCGGNNPPASGDVPSAGLPAAGIPAGFQLVRTDTTNPAPATGAPDGGSFQAYCSAYSWYTPCYNDNLLVVQTYVRPALVQWEAGTGGVAGLAPLSDPGTDTARVSLLFQERAYWLFLTGERQGDLRRLVRLYKRNPDQVYPRGSYPLAGSLPTYGTDVSANIPQAERSNPLFHGCLSRES